MRILLLALIAVDAAPKSLAPERPERLGSAFTWGEIVNDEGLPAQVYRNETLKRDETWHQTEAGEWFVKARDRVYVLAVREDDGWVTKPSERLERRDGLWKRVRR
jgi:hypothetical protein